MCRLGMMRGVRKVRLLGRDMSRRLRLRLGGSEWDLCLILGVGGLGLERGIGRGGGESVGGMRDLGGVRRLGRLDMEVRMGGRLLGLHRGRDGN